MENMRKSFEANLLYGDSVYDCGGCMLDAKEVWEFLEEILPEKLSQQPSIHIIKKWMENIKSKDDFIHYRDFYHILSGIIQEISAITNNTK